MALGKELSPQDPFKFMQSYRESAKQSQQLSLLLSVVIAATVVVKMHHHSHRNSGEALIEAFNKLHKDR